MGRTLPTINQQLLDTESGLGQFRRTLRRGDQYVFDGLFADARRHTAAISQTDFLLPFEAALLAMLLEQSKQIAILRGEIEYLKNAARSGE